jgi:hypothetical protein
VTVADTSDEFEKAIHAPFAVPLQHINRPTPAREVAWETTLDPLLNLMRTLARTGAGGKDLLCLI